MTRTATSTTTAPIVLNVGKAVGNTASGYTEPVPQRLRPRRPREGERLRWRWEGDRRRYQDRNGHKGVIEMAEDAAVRGAVALADYNVRAKRKSVASLLGEVNEYRAMIGFPPLALTPSGSAVSVKGQRLKDRPELLARVGLRAQRRSRSDNAASVTR